ncbi:MAG TPA: GDSL-type esterase/lipase family protein [Bryobacteraceae bacterium]|nr:GDSL-type esterase/lipase family protein [Bryobacteraceae bacterium]
MQWYEPEVEALERDIAARANGDHPPVFYGSSSIRLWATLAEDFDSHVLNLGFGGSTLQACDYFFSRLVPRVHPRSLLVYAGDNDLGDGRSVEDALSSFRSLAGKVTATLGSIPFGFVSVKPSPARSTIIDRIRLFNNLVRSEIEARPSGYYVDIYASMVNQSGTPRSELFLEDGLHLSREGYRLWGALLKPYRDQILTGKS